MALCLSLVPYRFDLEQCVVHRAFVRKIRRDGDRAIRRRADLSVFTRQQRPQGFVNVASVAYVINFQTGIFFVDSVDDAIAPYAIGTIAVEFAGQCHAHLTACEQGIDGRADKLFDFRRELGN
jgi:hypothetical protein